MFLSSEFRSIDSPEEGDFQGQFVRLRDGVTHYELAGPADGVPVVLIHGYSVPFYIWDPTFHFLAERGFRVLRYDLFGRGGSGRPSVEYGLDLYARQLEELLNVCFPAKPVHLLSICMGGIIAADFCLRYPARVAKLGFVAPAGFPTEFPFYTWLLRLPFWGEYLMQLYGDAQLLKSLDTHLHRPQDFPEYRDRYRTGMKYAGLKRALVSTARAVPFENSVALYRQVGAQPRPKLLVWGEQDRVLPVSLHAQVREAMPEIHCHLVPEAGHAAQYERPDLVNPVLLRFFASPPVRPARRRAAAVRQQ